MRLPNADRAYIPPEKLTAYLLSETHPVGKAKAKFFRGYGFDDVNFSALEQELLAIVQSHEVVSEKITPQGINYVIDGAINTPAGVSVRVRTVWVIETGMSDPRFVSAYPN